MVRSKRSKIKNSAIEVAIQFGESLDNDNFEATKKILSQNCKYIIRDEVLVGPVNICQSYEQNMIEGRKKLIL